MPCACSNRAAAALLPLPMPPVRPMISQSSKVIAIPTSPAQFKRRQYTEKGGQGCSAPASPSFALAGAPTQVEPLAGHLRLPPPTVGAPAPGANARRRRRSRRHTQSHRGGAPTGKLRCRSTHRDAGPPGCESWLADSRASSVCRSTRPGCEGFRQPLLFLKPRKPQITPSNPIPPDNGNPPRYRQIGPKGQGGGIGITTALENDDAQHGTHQRRQKNGQRQHLPATPSPEHGQQLEVAITHAFLAGDQLEYPIHHPQAQIAEHSTPERRMDVREQPGTVDDQ